MATATSALTTARLHCLREARAIISVAALTADPKSPPHYYNIAGRLGLPKAAADLADRLWLDANGAEDSTVESEERALERCEEMIRREMGR